MSNEKVLKKDTDVRTLVALDVAFNEANDEVRNKGGEFEWDTGAGTYYVTAKQAKFIRMVHNMYPDLKEAVALLAAAFEADNRVYESDSECDDREHDMQVAMGKASVLLDKFNSKLPGKEGPAARGLIKSLHYHGNNCPACDSSFIETTTRPELDTNMAWQEVNCGTCGFVWEDVYQLSNIDICEHQRIQMTKALNAAGISVYQSENHGYGFTFCESDNYETQDDALLSAWHYAVKNQLIATLSEGE